MRYCFGGRTLWRPWLGKSGRGCHGGASRPLGATRTEAAEVVQRLRNEAPAPFWIPLDVFQQPCGNKLALLAQYLEAQGLRPRQVVDALRLEDVQDEGRREPSKVLYDWRQRHPVTFKRQPSR